MNLHRLVMKIQFLWAALALLALTSACQVNSPQADFSPTYTLPSSQQISEIKLTAAPKTEPTLALSPTPTRAPEISDICSPLQDISLEQLSEIVSNPFVMPLAGNDGGHHGVDFGFYRFGSYSQMEGVPVQSLLSGVVAGIVNDRNPYGNAVIIETKTTELPPAWQKVLQSVSRPQLIPLDGKLNCPDLSKDILSPPPDSTSLYILYAHMEAQTTVEIGDKVLCGQTLGKVGTSGASINAHLHIETRLGYSGTQFSGMAHYINDASDLEIAQYCTWRISGLFQLIDPLNLLQTQP